MPIIKSAKKRSRQAETRRQKNLAIKRAVKNALKDFKTNPSTKTLSKVQSEYDKTVKKGLMKKNAVSRRKAKLAAQAKQAGVKIK